MKTTILQGDKRLEAKDITIDQRQRVISVKGIQFGRLVMNEAVWTPEGRAGISEGIRKAAEYLTRTCS